MDAEAASRTISGEEDGCALHLPGATYDQPLICVLCGSGLRCRRAERLGPLGAAHAEQAFWALSSRNPY